MRRSFFYDFSNYGTYDQLTFDGLTQWHPAFLGLGKTLDECAKKYRGFCQRYKPKPKPACKSNWGSKLLAGHKISWNKGKHKCSPGQLTLWEQCQVLECPQVAEVVKKFVLANRAFDVIYLTTAITANFANLLRVNHLQSIQWGIGQRLAPDNQQTPRPEWSLPS